MIPSAILSADWHIRATKPRCRTDDYLETQDKKVTFIFNLAKKYNCPIFVAGDLSEDAQWPNWLLRWFIHKIKKYKVQIYVIPGQHDLPYHRLKNWKKSGIGVLGTSGIIKLIGIEQKEIPEIVGIAHHWVVPFPFGYPISTIEEEKPNEPMVAVSHQMVVRDKALWPGQGALRGSHLLKKFPEYKLILTGDNHNPFVTRRKEQLLVNPGSMVRLKADQINHRPRVYLWYSEENKVRRVYLPIEKGVVSREHIEEKEIRNKRIDKYLDRLKTGYKVSSSYESNLEKHFTINKTEVKVKERVLGSFNG